MSAMTDYKYRKLRKMVSTSRVAKPVKELLFCALRDYKKERSIPEDGTFGPESLYEDRQEGRCLIGAAVHDVRIYNSITRAKLDNDIEERGLDWEQLAHLAFGTTSSQAGDIINGFDSVNDELTSYNKKNRTASLAARLAIELGLG